MYKKFALMLFSTTGALALGLTSALQATAATGTWVPYGNTNPITSSKSTWRCQSSIAVGPNLVSQVCTVRSASGTGVQGAVIVRNNNNYLYSTNAGMDVYYEGGGLRGYWDCPSSGVGANSWSVCFGSTFPANGYRYFTGGYANNRDLGTTPLN
jgi:hypothetical protein